jgi:methionyl-tRNA formyltransferase
MARGSLAFRPQAAEGVTYAAKIGNEDCRIDWARPAAEIHNQIRGLSPFPGAFAEIDLGKGAERLKVLRAEIASGAGVPGELIGADGVIACGTGAVRLITVQRAGKGPMPAADFLRGARIAAGAKLA